MNQHQPMVQTAQSRPYLGIIGCSYTHWADGDCLGKSYPGLIAKNFPDYNVVDLSIISASNDSAFLRLHNFEKQHNIKFTKIIWQLTHFNRELIFLDYNTNENIFADIQQSKNYYHTSGRFSRHINFTIHGRMHDAVDKLSDYFHIKKIDLYKYYVNKFGSNQNVWILQKEIDHVNSHYGKNNVLMFAWHKKIDRVYSGTNLSRWKWQTALSTNKSDTADDVEIDLPTNYIGSIEHMLGSDTFFELGIDNAPHYGPDGHSKVFDLLAPDVVKLMKGL